MEKKKRGEGWFTELSVVNSHVAMLDDAAAPKKVELSNRDCNNH